MEIKYSLINPFKIGNLIKYNNIAYTIYDIDENDELIYINNPELNNIGLPYSEISPLTCSKEMMNVCSFNAIENSIEIINKEGDLIETTELYKLNNDQIDFTVKIYNKYLNNKLIIDNKLENKIKYIHQVQNIFKHFFNIELIKIV